MKVLGAIGLIGVIAVLVAACGGSSNASSSQSSTSSSQSSAAASTTSADANGVKPLPVNGLGGPIGPLTGTEKQKQAIADGTAAGKQLGVVKSPKNLTIGFIQIAGGTASLDRTANAVEYASKALGYKFLSCDGRGIPAQWTTCGTTLIAQGADVLISSAIEPSAIPSVMTAAKKANIPFVSIAARIGPGAALDVIPDNKAMGQALGQYMVSHNPQVKNIAIWTYPAPFSVQQNQGFQAAIAGHGVKVSSTQETNPANPVQGTQQQVSDALESNPGVQALYFDLSSAGDPAAQVLQSHSGSRPQLYLYYYDQSERSFIQQGTITAVSDVNYDIDAWIALNGITEWANRGTKFAGYVVNPPQPKIGTLETDKVIDKANVPPAGELVAPDKDGVSYFVAKWKAEGLSQSTLVP